MGKLKKLLDPEFLVGCLCVFVATVILILPAITIIAVWIVLYQAQEKGSKKYFVHVQTIPADKYREYDKAVKAQTAAFTVVKYMRYRDANEYEERFGEKEVLETVEYRFLHKEDKLWCAMKCG